MTNITTKSMDQIYEELLAEVDSINSKLINGSVAEISLNTSTRKYSIIFDKAIPEQESFDIVDEHGCIHCIYIKRRAILKTFVKLIHLECFDEKLDLYAVKNNGEVVKTNIPFYYRTLIEGNVTLIRESERTGKLMLVDKKSVEGFLYEFLFPAYGRRKTKKGVQLPVFDTKKEAVRYCFVQNEFN